MKRDPDIRLVMDQRDGQFVHPGDRLSFYVHVFTNRPIHVLSLKVFFMSDGKCKRLRSVRHHDLEGDVSVQKERFAVTSVNVHAPSPKAGREDDEEPLVIGTGDASGPEPTWTRHVTLQVPSRHVPDTWRHSGRVFRARVTNILLAELTCYLTDPRDGAGTEGKRKVVRAVETLKMKQHAVVEDLATHSPAERTSYSWSGFPGFRRPIRCHLKARDQLVVQGHDIPLIVQVQNDSELPARKVTLTLYTEYTFKDYNIWRDHVPLSLAKEKVLRFSLPNVNPRTVWIREITGFTCPTHCLTSASLLDCPFIKVRFFVRLKVRCWLGSVKSDVPVHVGTESCEDHRLESSGLRLFHLPDTDCASN